MRARQVMIATIAGALVAGAWAQPASASRRHVRHHAARYDARPLTVNAAAIPVATDPFGVQNGETTDLNVAPDLEVGGGAGLQTPGLGSYGLAGAGLWGTAALR